MVDKKVRKSKNNGRGAPTKEVRIANKHKLAEDSFDNDDLKTKMLLSSHYYEYWEVLDKIAMGDIKGNQASAAKVCIEQALHIFKQEAKKGNTSGEDATTEVNDVIETSSLISLVPKEA